MTSAHQVVTSGSVRDWLLGPRFVDPGLRLLLLVCAGVVVLPSSFEYESPVYIAARLCAGALTLAAAYVPGAAGFLSVVGCYGIYFISPYNDRPFVLPAVAAVGMLVSTGRWFRAAAIAAGFFAVHFAAVRGADVAPTRRELSSAAVLLAASVLLGLLARAAQSRLQTAVDERVETARRSEREAAELKAQLARDAHDTVSHGLASEQAILRHLARRAHSDPRAVGESAQCCSADGDSGQWQTALTELSIVNAHTQQLLRLLLHRLQSTDSRDLTQEDMRIDLPAAAEALQRAACAGGANLKVNIAAAPQTCSTHQFEQILFILRELVTNVIKHADPGSPAAVTITAQPGDPAGSPEETISLRSENGCAYHPDRVREVPHTIAERAAASGGSAAVHHDGTRFSVQVTIPVQAGASPRSSDGP